MEPGVGGAITESSRIHTCRSARRFSYAIPETGLGSGAGAPLLDRPGPTVLHVWHDCRGPVRAGRPHILSGSQHAEAAGLFASARGRLSVHDYAERLAPAVF